MTQPTPSLLPSRHRRELRQRHANRRLQAC